VGAEHGETLRAFFGIPLSEEARRVAGELQRRLRRLPGAESVRWVRPEILHVTLRFLGDVARERVPELAREVGRALAGETPFELRLGAVRGFPSARRPRVVALEVEEPERLVALAAAVERGTLAAGFAPEERGFRAHVSLGRLRDGRPPAVETVAAPDFPPSPVREVILYRSELSPSGSRYECLERLALGGTVSP
jgi:2'-5' RNA ligase